MKKILLIDGNSFFYRSYFVSTKFSQNQVFTHNSSPAVYTAIKMLKRFLSERKSYHRIFVAFDLGKKTFRHQVFPSYKSKRKKTPDELIEQIPIFETFLNCLKVTFFKDSNFEADDLIATLTQRILDVNMRVDIVSSDHDLLQIVAPGVSLFLIKSGLSNLEPINSRNFVQKYHLQPEQITDFKALVGDSSDNLPGIKGIGPKTALNLLQKYHNLENIYHHLSEIQSNVQKKLIAYQQDGFMTKDLSKIKNNISMEFDLSPQIYNFYSPALIDFYQKYQMFSLLKKQPKQNFFEYDS